MDPKFRSSFIPKKTIAPQKDGVPVKRRSSFDLMSFIGGLIFLAAVIASAGVYGYKYVLQDGIDRKGIELTQARELINESQITAYKLLGMRLDTAEGLLTNHKVTSEFFTFLEDHTLHNVQFLSYGYDIDQRNPGQLAIELEGIAGSFESLVLQADALRRESFVSDVRVSNIEKNTETSDSSLNRLLFAPDTVSFKVQAVLDNRAVSYMVAGEGQASPDQE